jgi:hypothetical protein
VQLRSQLQGYAFHASGAMRMARDAVLRVAGSRITAMPWLYDYKTPPLPALSHEGRGNNSTHSRTQNDNSIK